MKEKLLFLLIFLINFPAFSQVIYEEGYFIDNDGKHKKASIKNVDWKNNPTEFEYKISGDSTSKVITLTEVAEFGIFGKAKYIRKSIDLDRSSDKIDELSLSGNPEFSEETVFLRTLIEGNASLFEYVESGLKRYFYSVGKKPVQALVYKRYSPRSTHDGNPDIHSNNHFQQQLWNDLKCEEVNSTKIKNLPYKKLALKKIIKTYNDCKDEAFADYTDTEERDAYHLSIRPGATTSSLETRQMDFGSKFGYRFGMELEYILPFNKNKWALIIEPTYQSYSSEMPFEESTMEASYKSIELPLGLRHYLFLNNRSKLFLNASAVIDFDMGRSRIGIMEIETKSFTNFAFGAGYNYNNNLSLELRYNLNRAVLGRHSETLTKFRSVAVILGINLF